MPDENIENQLSPEEEANFERQLTLAIQIAKEAVNQKEIPLLADDSQPVNARWDIFYQDKKNDVALCIIFSPPITSSTIYVSLGHISLRILIEVETLLSNQKAMDLLNVEESDRELVIYDKTLTLTKDYISYLPYVIYHSFHQTVSEVLISHVRKFVENDLRQHWETLGLPKNYSLIPDNNLANIEKLFPETELRLIPYLETINEEFLAYRKSALNNRQAWLIQAFGRLPDDYKEFQAQYKKAKKEYKLEREAFFRTNRRAELSDWDKHWEKYCDEKFPDLFLTKEIPNYTPSQLTYRHLSQLLDFSPDYMEKIVGNARKQAKDKSNQQKDPTFET